jgi:hypothetical protein
MATSITAATASAVASVGTGNPAQFQSLFDVIPFKCSLLDTTIPAGAAQADITVQGAELGDFVFVCSQIDAVDAYLTGFVNAANSVTVAIVTGQHVDATTTFATTAKRINGFLLKPKGDFDSMAN